MTINSDLRPLGIDGARVERLLECCSISVNKNAVPGDTSALRPGGVRIGAPALTSRGFKEPDFVRVAQLIDRGVQLTAEIAKVTSGSSLDAFDQQLEGSEFAPKVNALKNDVRTLATGFPIPGLDF